MPRSPSKSLKPRGSSRLLKNRCKTLSKPFLVRKNIDVIIVAGPSGVGKSSLVDKVTTEVPILFDTVTYTTRAMRKGEKEGVPYHFVNDEKFKELIEKNFFVEWAHVHNKMYGTSRV